jgi:acetyltransferase-like isoleucine patch superfamily enzyme
MKLVFNIIRILVTYILYPRQVKGFGVIVKGSKLYGLNCLGGNVLVSKCELNGTVYIANASKAHNCTFEGHNSIGIYTNITNCTIGKFSYIADNGLVNNTSVGRYCSIGANFKVGLGSHPLNFASTSPTFYKKSFFVASAPDTSMHFTEYKHTQIGNDVWIGANVFMNDGVKIGDGAVIGAGAVVTADVASYAIVGGIPAKLIRYRFDHDVVKDLVALQWWDRDIDWIKRNLPFFQKPIGNGFIGELKQ